MGAVFTPPAGTEKRAFGEAGRGGQGKELVGKPVPTQRTGS